MFVKSKIWVVFLLILCVCIGNLLHNLYFIGTRQRVSVFSVSQRSRWIIVNTNTTTRTNINNIGDAFTILLLKTNKNDVFTKENNVIVASKSGILKSDVQFIGLNPDINLRSLGILYAIKNRALTIYEADSISNVKFSNSRQQTGLVKHGSKLFNPGEHFGVYLQTAIVPKLSYTLTKVSCSIEHVVSNEVTLVNQLWNSAPLLVKSHNKYICDTKSPPVFLAKGVFSPFVSKNTLFRSESFWCLYIPTVTNPEYEDLFRNLICQRLLWEIGRTVGFYPPSALPTTDTTIKFNDDVTQTRHIVNNLVTFLSIWKCDRALTVYGCMIQLNRDLVKVEFLNRINVGLVKTWINMLHTIKYIEPKRSTETVLNKHLKNKFKSHFWFYPSQEPRPPTYYLDRLSRLCPNLISLKEKAELMISTSSDIVLIVVFNSANYNNIPNIQTVYGQTFSQIIFCGSNKTEFEIKSEKFNFTGSFIETNILAGTMFYRCMSQIMKMKHDVAGYLLIGDDVLINSWNIHTYPLDKIWLKNSSHARDINKTDKTWGHWGAMYGQQAVKAMLVDLQTNHPKKYSQFKDVLAHNTGYPNTTYVYNGGSDVVYVPKRLRKDMEFFLDLFSNHTIFMEITFPTVLHGIERKENMFTVVDGYMWATRDKLNFAKKFNPKHFFIHPYKIGPMLKTDIGKSFFCNVYTPNLFLNK